MHGEGRHPVGNEGTVSLGLGQVCSQALTLKGFVLQVRGTANSGKSGDLSTHVAGEGCEPWGQGGDPRAAASVSVSLSLDFLWTVYCCFCCPLFLTCTSYSRLPFPNPIWRLPTIV